MGAILCFGLAGFGAALLLTSGHPYYASVVVGVIVGVSSRLLGLDVKVGWYRWRLRRERRRRF